MTFTKLPLKDITLGDNFGFSNARESLTEIKALAADIKQRGLLNPLQVWKVKKDDKILHILIGGHRRLAAIQSLGHTEAPVCLIEAKTFLEARYTALADNLQRVNLTSYELTQEIVRLRQVKETVVSIATSVRKSEAWVSARVKAWQSAGDALKLAWRAQKVPDDTVFDLAGLPKDEQEDALEKVLTLRTGGKKGRGKARAAAKKKKGKETDRDVLEKLLGKVTKIHRIGATSIISADRCHVELVFREDGKLSFITGTEK